MLRDHIWEVRAGEEPRMTPRVWTAPAENEIGSPGEELELATHGDVRWAITGSTLVRRQKLGIIRV